jgi:hypothetical protein
VSFLSMFCFRNLSSLAPSTTCLFAIFILHASNICASCHACVTYLYATIAVISHMLLH